MKPGRVRTTVSMVAVWAVGVAALVAFGGASRVGAANASDTDDVSAAVRYDTSRGGRQVYGYVVPDLFDEDDESVLLPMPFPINFFGSKYTHACVTTNGVIFPANDGDSCSDDYDYGVGDLTLEQETPAMAVLELDLDGGEDLLLTDGRDIDDLDGSANATLAGGILTFSSSGHSLLAGDHVAFVETGTILDTGGSYPVTVVDSNTFTIPVPGVTDLDTSTGGNQTSVSTGDWTYSNGVGTRGVYVGEATIGDAPAYVVTWYRYPHNDDDNPEDLSSTLQLVLLKGTGGSDAEGWDFVVEYNIGTMTDDEDGYQFDDPSTDCTAWDPEWDLSTTPPTPGGDQRDQCRWGMGFGSFVGDIALSSISVTGGVATLTTAGAHGIDDTGIGVRLELPSDGRLGSLSGDVVWGRKVDATSFRIDTTDGDAASIDITGLVMNAADVYELFSTTSIADLVDSGGTSALVRNSLNTTVLGRYRFGMAGGSVTAFKAPSMDGSPNVAPGIPDDPDTGPPDSGSDPEPVRNPNGTLPNLMGGVIRVFEAGRAVKVTTTVRNRTTLVVRGNRFGLQLKPRCTSGCTIQRQANGRNVVVVKRDGRVAVSGYGYEPGSRVDVWLFSTPQLLRQLIVGSNGRFSGQVSLRGIAVGNHTLQMNGTSVTGESRTANLGVVVGRSRGSSSALLPGTGGGLGQWAWLLGRQFIKWLKALERLSR